MNGPIMCLDLTTSVSILRRLARRVPASKVNRTFGIFCLEPQELFVSNNSCSKYRAWRPCFDKHPHTWTTTRDRLHVLTPKPGLIAGVRRINSLHRSIKLHRDNPILLYRPSCCSCCASPVSTWYNAQWIWLRRYVF
jgi:hypothetical protein